MPVKKSNDKKVKKTSSKKNGFLSNASAEKKDRILDKKKRINKKKEAKKTTIHEASLDKKEIKEAVKKIPGLIIKELEQKTLQTQTLEKKQSAKPKIADIYQTPRNKKMWLWSAVVIFTAIILGLWALNISTFFHNVQTQENSAGDIMEQGKNDFQTILQTLQDNEKKLGGVTVESETEPDTEDTKKIKKALEKTLGTLLNATTTTNTPNTN